jgi:beta-glucosidase/6-phospho-beta-glucosidase/beta-galactosidase
MGGYLAGMMPPGKKDPIGGLKAMRNMVSGHALAYDAIHQADPDAKVSFNMYTAEFTVGRTAPKTAEQKATEHIVSDTDFADFVVNQGREDGGSSKLDYAAFDYYCKFHLRLPFKFPRADTWEVYPEGIYKAVHRYHDRYHLPVLIAENGVATWDGAPRADGWTRSSYTVAHVKQVQRAIAEGVPVMGYIQWSITDNYEWGTFGPRFGLYAVDCRNGNFKRVATDGVDAFKAIIAGRGATPALEARFPAPRLASGF